MKRAVHTGRLEPIAHGITGKPLSPAIAAATVGIEDRGAPRRPQSCLEPLAGASGVVEVGEVVVDLSEFLDEAPGVDVEGLVGRPSVVLVETADLDLLVEVARWLAWRADVPTE